LIGELHGPGGTSVETPQLGFQAGCDQGRSVQ